MDDLHLQAGADLAVVPPLVSAGPAELAGRRRDQQLEEEVPVPPVQPRAETGEPLGLPAVQLPVTLGVVADEHLGERRAELVDMAAELVAVLEVELGLARLLDRHRQHVTGAAGLARHARPVLLVHQDACRVTRHPAPGCLDKPLVDHFLGVGDPGPDLVRDRVGRTEQVVLE